MTRNSLKFFLYFISLSLIFGLCLLIIKTNKDLKPVETYFLEISKTSKNIEYYDKNGDIISTPQKSKWNENLVKDFYEFPELIVHSFIHSEDKRFYSHKGVDWLARFQSALQNIQHLRYVRGGSTITEQVVRMINPRPRKLWSKWVEGWEAIRLETYISKEQILTFYLNQVPYASNKRGISQAASYYFNRSIETLSPREILALTVLVRAPSKFDLYKDSHRIDKRVNWLALKLKKNNILSEDDYQRLLKEKLSITPPKASIKADHFIDYVSQSHPNSSKKIYTTLDLQLQNKVQKLLDKRLKKLKKFNVNNGAILIADHQTGDILSWVTAFENQQNIHGSFLNAALNPRQPGSTLKPFLYSLALEKGWSAATLINDAPLSETIRQGFHQFQNYSRIYYGPVTVRQALGNSLNIPAIKAALFVTKEDLYQKLKQLGLKSLTKKPEFYGDGLALGNGEVSLFELVQAYMTLANKGVFTPLSPFQQYRYQKTTETIYNEEVTSIISHILSDPHARDLEFGRYSLLNLPVQTAVKTGTSNDFRDAWVVGYNYKYIIGIWMGNSDQTPMDGLTGSKGPAPLLHSLFAEINDPQKTKKLYLSPGLIPKKICNKNGDIVSLSNVCLGKLEWFQSDYLFTPLIAKKETALPRFKMPTEKLSLAIDPRHPMDKQKLEFHINHIQADDDVNIIVNNQTIPTKGPKYLWPLKKGSHKVKAFVKKNGQTYIVPEVSFTVH